MSELEFRGFPKIPRLNRNIVVTEKIDGTNGAIVISEDGNFQVQSRNRILTLATDNHGFAKWAYDNRDALIETLGEGYHYGEWWGFGINRGYGLKHGEKYFSLFNTYRWYRTIHFRSPVPGLSVVPVLYNGVFSQEEIQRSQRVLQTYGSLASPGYREPEGIVIFHEHAKQLFKVTLKNDEVPKGLVEQHGYPQDA